MRRKLAYRGTVISSDARFASLLDRRRAAVLLLVAASVSAAPAEAAPARQVTYQQWATGGQLARGSFQGTVRRGGKVVFDRPTASKRLRGRTYDVARWTSPLVTPGHLFTELVPSWRATTPGSSWVRVEVRGVTPSGASTGWDNVSRWAQTDAYVARKSLRPQPDGGAKVDYDTWVVSRGAKQWQLRVSFFRQRGTTAGPVLETIGAVVSRNATVVAATSKPLGIAAGRVLPVPAYSQMTHEGEYPEYDGGGEAWCSPTSTSMVLGYYGKLPAATEYAWVRKSYPDRFVAHAARMTFDHSFDGTGNWPFNTGYAAPRTGKAFVTRLANLQDAERFVAAGIPVVASIAFGKGQLTGAPISSTNGHLLVIVGFTATGDVVVNDPAAPGNGTVRRTYRRSQLEAAWLRRSGGIAYVVADKAHPLPARVGTRRW